MDKKTEIKSSLFEKTKFLKQYGYIKVIEESDVWNLTLSYLSTESGLAIEFEVDFRDLDVFVLITILEDSELPAGYYMNKCKRVRVHLEKLLEMGKIKTGDLKQITHIRQELKEATEQKIQILIDAYCLILKEVISEIQQLDCNEF